MLLKVFPPHPIFLSLARRTETPGAPGFLKCQTGGFEFCRFCHFRVLTAKSGAHITRLADDEALRRAAPATLKEWQRCCRATGRTFLFPKIRKRRFHDAALERGSQGPLFDIVKMEERETWTARFLRSDREIGQTDFDGTFSLRGTLPITRGSPRSDRCVSSSICIARCKRKTCRRRPSQISNLRV